MKTLLVLAGILLLSLPMNVYAGGGGGVIHMPSLPTMPRGGGPVGDPTQLPPVPTKKA